MIGNLGNRLQNIYANRRNYAQTTQKLVGGGRKIISAPGRTNEFDKIGISNPQISVVVGATGVCGACRYLSFSF